jgi:hypothetical protein
VEYKRAWVCSQTCYLNKRCSVVARAKELAPAAATAAAAAAAATTTPSANLTPAEFKEAVERVEKELARYQETSGS